MFEPDSLGALHVAIVAGIIGYLVYSLSHAWSVWSKRNREKISPHGNDG